VSIHSTLSADTLRRCSTRFSLNGPAQLLLWDYCLQQEYHNRDKKAFLVKLLIDQFPDQFVIQKLLQNCMLELYD
jgi:hypothetical protein